MCASRISLFPKVHLFTSCPSKARLVHIHISLKIVLSTHNNCLFWKTGSTSLLISNFQKKFNISYLVTDSETTYVKILFSEKISKFTIVQKLLIIKKGGKQFHSMLEKVWK